MDMRPRERLELFKARANQLADSRLLKRGFNPGISIRYERMRGTIFESREPDEEDLRSFLLTFRQFVSNDEPIFLSSIYNLCRQCLTSGELKGYLVQSRDAWKRALRGRGFKIVFDEGRVTPEEVADLWINGWYFHSDNEKMRRLKSLIPEQQIMARWLFLDFVAEATRQVFYVRNLITVALRDGLIDPNCSYL